jgi:hypothetical protein
MIVGFGWHVQRHILVLMVTSTSAQGIIMANTK